MTEPLSLPGFVNYPLIAITDLHGQHRQLERLVSELEKLPAWNECALVFVGDYVDRNSTVKQTIDLVLQLLSRPAGGSAVMGNHDLALVRAAGLDDQPPSEYWIEGYRDRYDHRSTFQSYLGRSPSKAHGWRVELDALKAAMPVAHRQFLGSLNWVVEAPGHLFLHCGLSPELEATAEEQLAALHARRWERTHARPRKGSATEQKWTDDYPVWIGADPMLTERPLPFPDKIQVTGHKQVPEPLVNSDRIRIDTSGGDPSCPLSAAFLMSATAEPVFISVG